MPVSTCRIIKECSKNNYLKQKEGQLTLFDIFNLPTIERASITYPVPALKKKTVRRTANGQEFLQIQSRRYLGNKFKLLSFIREIVEKECGKYKSVCDIFAGTGVVGNEFNEEGIKIISNELLHSNYVSLYAWLSREQFDKAKIAEHTQMLNEIQPIEENYVSENFGRTYFTLENARKIGAIREKIEELRLNFKEKCILLTSLLYAIDKVANTGGHYDAFRRDLDTLTPIKLLFPDIQLIREHYNMEETKGIWCSQEDAERQFKEPILSKNSSKGL